MLVLPLAAGCTPERKPNKIVLPEGFEGGATIVWGNLSSPPLPTEGAMYVIEIPAGGVLKTSTPLQAGKGQDQLFWRKGTELVAVPEDRKADRTTGHYKSCGEVEDIFIGDKGKLATMRTEVEARLDLICSGAGSTPQGLAIPTVEPGVGIGQVRLGMTRAELDKLGFPIKEGPFLEVGSYRVTMDGDRVGAIETTLSVFADGLRVGTELVPPKEPKIEAIIKGLPGCGKVDVRIGDSVVTCADGTAHVKAVGPGAIVVIDVMTKAHAAAAAAAAIPTTAAATTAAPAPKPTAAP
jgi:hypothetical protein